MGETEYEFRVDIDGERYGMDTLTSVNISQPLFDKFSVGLACCACMIVKYRFDLEPSRGAKLVAYCRPLGSNDPWYQLGVFFIDLRSTRTEVKTLTCYDSMMKADIQFLDNNDTEFVDEWPKKMYLVVQEIAERMGIKLDSRTHINPTYTIDYPNDDTMRTMLQYIAAAHAGNWIITRNDELLLVPLYASMPPETFFLVEENGSPIAFGEDRILV